MAHTAADQRIALVEALRNVPENAPTLCEGWAAKDLALHIVVRDSRPDLMAGERLPVVGSRARGALRDLERTDYQVLIDRVEAGPPRWSPARLAPVDNLTNTVEFYVHTEDVLRAQPDFTADDRRAINPEVQAQLWKQGTQALFLLGARSQRQRITFLSPRHGAVTRGKPTDPLCIIQGAPEELVLWAFGRKRVAEVEVNHH